MEKISWKNWKKNWEKMSGRVYLPKFEFFAFLLAILTLSIFLEASYRTTSPLFLTRYISSGSVNKATSTTSLQGKMDRSLIFSDNTSTVTKVLEESWVLCANRIMAVER